MVVRLLVDGAIAALAPIKPASRHTITMLKFRIFISFLSILLEINTQLSLRILGRQEHLLNNYGSVSRRIILLGLY